MGTSEDEVTMSRPGRLATSASGRNTVWSTPTGTTVSRSRGTCIWRLMSMREFAETVSTAGSSRATRTCMRRKPNHRRVVNRCHAPSAWSRAIERSTVIGWWSVSSSGQPRRCSSRIPEPRHWLSWTRSNSSRLRGRARSGSGASTRGARRTRRRSIVVNSTTSVSEVNSRRAGIRKGSGSRYRSSPRTGVKPDALVELGPRRPGEHLDAVAERDELARQVAGVDALAAAARVAPVDEERDAPAALGAAGRGATRVGQHRSPSTSPRTPARRGRTGGVTWARVGTPRGRWRTIVVRGRAVAQTAPRGARRAALRYDSAMDLTYPPEAEAFRAEIRAWLEENLPEGWFDEGFSMTAEERRQFNKEWPERLYKGGWICASWPVEYEGKGLTHPRERRAQRGVRPRRGARCARTSSATPSSARRSCSGAPRSRSTASSRGSCTGRRPGARGSASRTRAATSPRCRRAPCSTATSG